MTTFGLTGQTPQLGQAPSRRAVLAAGSLVAVGTTFGSAGALAARDATPFRVAVPESALEDLRRRLAGARWPEPATEPGWVQGARLSRLQALSDYWRTGYDWRRLEARLNAYDQYRMEIDGLNIHYLHVRSAHSHALPIILTHGWPGSIVEFLKVIAPLTNPTAHGGTVGDAFDVVVPSLPGFGFSDKPSAPGWDAFRIARAWTVLMGRLGYRRWVAQGGDVGAVVTNTLAL